MPLLSLRKECIVVLIRHRQFLGDLGDIDGASVREILSHCSCDELAYIEDCTREGVSERDLCWYSWHLWAKHYREKLGSPPADLEILPLPGEPPGDYTEPACSGVPEGERRMPRGCSLLSCP